jgi:uncharacterized protein with gpF-like domain
MQFTRRRGGLSSVKENDRQLRWRWRSKASMASSSSLTRLSALTSDCHHLLKTSTSSQDPAAVAAHGFQQHNNKAATVWRQAKARCIWHGAAQRAAHGHQQATLDRSQHHKHFPGLKPSIHRPKPSFLYRLP